VTSATKLLVIAALFGLLASEASAQRAVRGSSLILDDNGTTAGANNRITISTPSDANLTTNYSLILPATPPAAGFSLMVTDAAGQMTFLNSGAPQAGYTLVAGADGAPTWTAPTANAFLWSTAGNNGLNAANNFLGTLDNQSVRFITNGTGNVRMEIDGTSGLVTVNNGLNLAGANAPLQLNGDAGTLGGVMISGGNGATPSWSNLISIVNNNVTIGGDTLNLGTTSNTINQGGPTTNQFFQGDTLTMSIGGGDQIFIDQSVTSISGDTTIVNANNEYFTTVAGDTVINIDATSTNITNENVTINGGNTFTTIVAGDTAISIDATTTVISGDTTIIQGDSVVSIVVGGDTAITFGDTITINNPVTFGDTVVFNTLPTLPLPENYIFLGNAADQADTLAPGTEGQVLAIVSGKPTWTTPTLSKGIADPIDGAFTVTIVSPVAISASSVINITHVSAVGGGAYIAAISPGAAGVGSFTVMLPGPADASDIIHWTINP
jgi:hypothetical protein